MHIYTIFIVSNARQAIELLKFIHEEVKQGKSVNAALKDAKKDRKSVDRFRNIYYLHSLDNDQLKEVSLAAGC